MKEIKPGTILREFPAGSFNEMQRRIKRLEASRLPRRRRRIGGGAPTFVAITDAIAAPTWNAGTAKLTPTDCEFPVFYPHEDEDGTWTIDSETTTTFKSFLKVTIDAPATGKYRRGIVVGGKLIAIQCEEEDLPAGWGE